MAYLTGAYLRRGNWRWAVLAADPETTRPVRRNLTRCGAARVANRMNAIATTLRRLS
jgi:hypothetical protein